MQCSPHGTGRRVAATSARSRVDILRRAQSERLKQRPIRQRPSLEVGSIVERPVIDWTGVSGNEAVKVLERLVTFLQRRVSMIMASKNMTASGLLQCVISRCRSYNVQVYCLGGRWSTIKRSETSVVRGKTGNQSFVGGPTFHYERHREHSDLVHICVQANKDSILYRYSSRHASGRQRRLCIRSIHDRCSQIILCTLQYICSFHVLAVSGRAMVSICSSSAKFGYLLT